MEDRRREPEAEYKRWKMGDMRQKAEVRRCMPKNHKFEASIVTIVGYRARRAFYGRLCRMLHKKHFSTCLDFTFLHNSKTRGQHEVGCRSGDGQRQNPFPIDFACIFLRK